MRIVVTGTTGQVVNSLLERAKALADAGAVADAGASAGAGAGAGAGGALNVAVEVIALGRPALDLAEPAGIAPALAAAFGGSGPDLVVSAAAYTAVDKAEEERDIAFAVNGAGAGAVAAAAQALGVPLIHISTDYVFDGTNPAPYVESDRVAPLGAYGASKLAGEAAVLAAHPGAVILRTAWVYSPFGGNFVKTMLRLAENPGDAGTPREIGVVADQIGNPTSALDIADGILALARRLVDEPASPRGIFHMVGGGEASWADLAEAVFVASAVRGGPSASVRRITTANYPTRAPRPANSRLDGTRLAEAYAIRLPDWHSSLEAVVARLVPAWAAQDSSV